VQNFSSQKANRPFIRKKAFRTNLKGAPVAELQGRIVNGIMAVTLDKCIRPYALSAARRPKCLLGRRPTSRFIARTVISPENAVETDINSALAPAEPGGGFLLDQPFYPPDFRDLNRREDMKAISTSQLP